MGNLNTFSAAIVSKLQSVQLSGSSAFVEVVDYPTNQFSGYPAASVMPADIPSEFITVAQNQRAYGFKVDLYVGLDQESNWSTSYTTMRDLVDAVLDALDQSIDLDGTCDFLRASAVGDFLPLETGQGLELWAELRVVAIKDVDVR